jgi:hypothetical protein
MKSLNDYEVQAVSGGFLGGFTPFAFSLGLISGRSGFPMENAISSSIFLGAVYSFWTGYSENIMPPTGNLGSALLNGITDSLAGAGAALIFSHIGYEIGKSFVNETASA